MKKKGEYGKRVDFNAYNLRPASSYLSDLSSFGKEKSDYDDLIGSIKEAEKAANELLKETSVKPTAVSQGEKPQSSETEAVQEKPDVDELMKELDSLVGLEKIKENVKSLINLVKVRKLRSENDLSVPPISLHMVFMGNPGTGKTTVARLISKLYWAIGVLSKGQLVEVDRSGLVAGYVGQTAIKTSEVIKKAMGGVLFIDEAYALANGGENTNDFGQEAIETLLKAMEDNRDDLVVIVAGYEDLMEKFISSNPGLESRFNRYFMFEDYNGDELFEIFKMQCSKNEYVLAEDAEEMAKAHFKDVYEQRDENFGNARDVRNIFENIVTIHSDRLAAMEAPTKEDLMTILKEDFEKASLM